MLVYVAHYYSKWDTGILGVCESYELAQQKIEFAKREDRMANDFSYSYAIREYKLEQTKQNKE